MTTALQTIIFPARDLARSKALLGVEPTMDTPYYVGFDVGSQHVGLNPHGHDQGMTTAGGKLTATVSDSDGNVVGLIQAP